MKRLPLLLFMSLFACSSCIDPQPTSPVDPGQAVHTTRLDPTKLAQLDLPQASPTFTVAQTPQDLVLAESVVRQSGIEFSYINGGCHGRAHALTTMLAARGIQSYKIWAFPPGKYSLVRSELIEVETRIPGAEHETITWGFHVAAAIVSKNGERILDPAISNESLALDAWLAAFDCEDCYILATDPNWYLFNTLDGYMLGDITIPKNFPSVWTGGFWECQQSPCPFMLAELAMNDAAAALLRELEAKPEDVGADEIRALLFSVAALEQTLISADEPALLAIRAAKQVYTERLEYWTERMTQLGG